MAFPDADEYGRSLRALTINLLVRDVEKALPFYRGVLGATLVHTDEGFAVFRWGAAEWMLHADATYHAHPLAATLASGAERGIGAELRLHGGDPDAVESRAKEHGYGILAPATDKPHGLREVYVLDGDGYLWVVDRPITP